jgi:protein-S-isoprenylcysteine O-methyltransferase Ste14
METRVIKISKGRTGLGSEHPLCDRIQLLMVVLFFAVWGLDSLSFFVFGYSMVIFGPIPLVVHLLLAFISTGFGVYLIAKSHQTVFGDAGHQSRLIDSSVYSWVRHPMYLGILMFCLGFFFASSSIISLVVWLAFFILYDKMATYEEKDLIRTLGKEYIDCQKRVPKWFPKLALGK